MELLRTENVVKEYGGQRILDGISIELHHGEIVSLLGVSGAGKTTLFNIISGLVVPESGRVFLDGEDITGSPGKISYMLQKDLLLQHKKIIDNVSLPLVLGGMKKAEARKKADALFAEFGLDGTQMRYPSQLSGGMRQRAALLRTYMASEGVALLDEPFSALDTLTKSSMHRWYLDEAILLSDRIYILKGRPGRITCEIPVTEPKPRSPEFNLSESFLAYKRRIISEL